MEFKADACYTPEGIAYVNPAKFKLVNSILNPFKDFPLALVDLKPLDRGGGFDSSHYILFQRTLIFHVHGIYTNLSKGSHGAP